MSTKTTSSNQTTPKYPIYIPSKSRWESRLTSRALERIGVSYHIVIEPHEFDQYAAVIDKSKILLLPWSKPDSNNELTRSRNWIKQHAIESGAKRHWQLDDNIDGFCRLNKNKRIAVDSGATIRAIEDFVDRYTNVAIAGMNYRFFAPARQREPAYRLNTRVYSCSLVLNSIPHEWRGIYNDDTDICLRVLKDGWCTILFLAFLCNKAGTMTVKGGNTDIYQDDGRLKMAKSLVEQHPNVATITHKWGRWQHQVDYRQFRHNRLNRRANVKIENGVDNYGMTLKKK